MKFKSHQDKQLFLLELGKVDIYSTIEETWNPPSDLIEMYIKSRSELIPGLTDFRKSQNTKDSWRRNRHKYMKGIKNFHRSTKGKRFHRAMSSFLLNHESFKEMVHPPLFETLKAVNSLKTHLYIELEYYMPVNEYMDLIEVLEHLIPCTNRVEQSLLQGSYSISNDDKELLLRLTEPDELIESLSSRTEKSVAKIRKVWEDQINEDLKDDSEFFYISILNNLSNTQLK